MQSNLKKLTKNIYTQTVNHVSYHIYRTLKQKGHIKILVMFEIFRFIQSTKLCTQINIYI